MSDPLKLLVSIIVCQLVGITASLFEISSNQWYAGLHKPVLTPPGWLFAPVWTILYLLMGIAAYAVWKLGFSNWHVRHALILFAAQLILNFAWSGMFFGLHSISAGLADIVLLWIALIFNIIAFFNLSITAGVLMVPYFLWVSFATILNLSILLLN